MRKIVKGHIEKNYCDQCGALLYDVIPTRVNNEISEMFGVRAIECKYKTYMRGYIIVGGKRFCNEDCEHKWHTENKRR